MDAVSANRRKSKSLLYTIVNPQDYYRDSLHQPNSPLLLRRVQTAYGSVLGFGGFFNRRLITSFEIYKIFLFGLVVGSFVSIVYLV